MYSAAAAVSRTRETVLANESRLRIMAKLRQGRNRSAQQLVMSPRKLLTETDKVNGYTSNQGTYKFIHCLTRILSLHQKIATTKATHPQAQLSPIKSRRRSKSKRTEDEDYTPLKALPSRDDTKTHRARYTKLKFHVNQTVSTYPDSIYKSFDKDPQPALPQWVSPSFGPEVSLRHVREAIIKPGHLPTSMLTPIDRLLSKRDPPGSSEHEEVNFPALDLTPSTSPFPR